MRISDWSSDVCSSDLTAIDTTIWARFSQPVACAWARDADARSAVVTDVTQAVVNAARWAARLGPKSGTANDYWQQLYQHTYAVELRVERGGARAQTLLSKDRKSTRLNSSH